jgi:hypothetical protein
MIAGTSPPRVLRSGVQRGGSNGWGGQRCRAGWDPPIMETPRKEVVQWRLINVV